MSCEMSENVPPTNMESTFALNSPRSLGDLARPEIQLRLQRQCNELHLSDDVANEAWAFWMQFMKHEAAAVDDVVQWFSPFLYISITDMEIGKTEAMPTSALVTVTDILQKTNTSVKEFLEKMKLIQEIIPISERTHNHLLLLKNSFCINSALYDKLQRMWNKIFVTNDSLCNLNDSRTIKVEKQKCWELFVCAKETLLGYSSDLVPSFHVLLICVSYILKEVPCFLLNSPFSDIASDMEPTLLELCRDHNCRREEVVSLWKKSFITSFFDTSTPLFLPSLVDNYTAAYRRRRSLNDLLFAENDSHLLRNLSMADSRKPRSPRKYASMPIKSSIKSVQKLQQMLSQQKNGPSNLLEEICQSCSDRTLALIENQVANHHKVFLSCYLDKMNNVSAMRMMAGYRFSLGTRLYYRILEQFLQQERLHLSDRMLEALLHNSVLHSCMLACAIEVVLHTFAAAANDLNPAVPTIKFPWILSVFHVHPFDFFKVLETFRRSENFLEECTMNHLQMMEVIILEELAWKYDSPVFRLIATCTVSAAEAAVLESPVKPMLPSCLISPVRQCDNLAESPLKQRKSQSLNLFFKKVFRLCYGRLQKLVGLLNIKPEIERVIWECVEEAFIKFSELLVNRHIDQILMCSIYGICKVLDHEVKLKYIASVYKTLPDIKSETYRCVQIFSGETDTIIGFYNRVFMQTMKSSIMSRGCAVGKLFSPRVSVGGGNKFFVSPLKMSPFKVPESPSLMTPRTRSLFSFGDQLNSTEKLRAINESLKKRSGSSSVGKSHKKLKF